MVLVASDEGLFIGSPSATERTPAVESACSDCSMNATNKRQSRHFVVNLQCFYFVLQLCLNHIFPFLTNISLMASATHKFHEPWGEMKPVFFVLFLTHFYSNAATLQPRRTKGSERRIRTTSSTTRLKTRVSTQQHRDGGQIAYQTDKREKCVDPFRIVN